MKKCFFSGRTTKARVPPPLKTLVAHIFFSSISSFDKKNKNILLCGEGGFTPSPYSGPTTNFCYLNVGIL